MAAIGKFAMAQSYIQMHPRSELLLVFTDTTNSVLSAIANQAAKYYTANPATEQHNSYQSKTSNKLRARCWFVHRVFHIEPLTCHIFMQNGSMMIP